MLLASNARRAASRNAPGGSAEGTGGLGSGSAVAERASVGAMLFGSAVRVGGGRRSIGWAEAGAAAALVRAPSATPHARLRALAMSPPFFRVPHPPPQSPRRAQIP